MRETNNPHSSHGLEHHGLYNLSGVYWNLPTGELYEQAVLRREGSLAHLGPLVVRTGHHTGRSANDKFIVFSISCATALTYPIAAHMPHRAFTICAIPSRSGGCCNGIGKAPISIR